MLTNIKFSNLISELFLFVALIVALTLVGCHPSETTVPVAAAEVQEEQTPTTPVTLVEEAAEEVVPIVEPEPTVIPEPEPPQEIAFSDAEAAYRNGDYSEATDLFSQYTEQHAANPWGFYMFGLSAWKGGDLEQAETAFIEAIRLDASHTKSWINLSRVHLDAGKPTDAVAALNEAIALDAVSNETYRLQGRAYDQLGEKEEAITAYREALILNGTDVWSLNNLGLVYIQEQQYDEALPVLALAVETRSDIAVFYNNLGMALEHTGHYRAAEEAYQAAVDLRETYEKANINLARVEQVDEDPMQEPIDLAEVAKSFAEEVATWSKEEVANETLPQEEKTPMVEQADEELMPEVGSVEDASAQAPEEGTAEPESTSEVPADSTIHNP